MITGQFFLLESPFLFLIDNNKAQLQDRGKYGGPGSQHQSGLSLFDACPFCKALSICHAAVQDSHATDPGSEYLNQLPCQSNFRNQHDDTLASSQSQLGCPQIDLGLAAAGDSEQEHFRILATVQGFLDLRNCQFLFGAHIPTGF